MGFALSRFASVLCASVSPERTTPMPSLAFAIILALLACHYWQESLCGHHSRRACLSLAAAAIAYSVYAAKVALAGG
jgi:hypothetical protein